MMYETNAGSGEYEESKSTSWPESGYIFNSVLSKCENGSTLAWDDIKKVVKMSGNVSDRCYVYFDMIKPTLSDVCNNKIFSQCIKDNYTLDSNIYYHITDLTNGAGDNSYRYSGSLDEVKNYVCFGTDEATCPDDNLYRIIGVFDENIKLIKYNAIGSYERGDYNWKNASLNTNILNNIYYNKFDSYWKSIIVEKNWQVGANLADNTSELNANKLYSGEVKIVTSDLFNANIGLMYVSDYAYAADPSAWTTKIGNYDKITNANWMYMGISEWTISKEYRVPSAFYIYSNGVLSGSNIDREDRYSVRPSFYLKYNVLMVGGSGTKTDPYRIRPYADMERDETP